VFSQIVDAKPLEPGLGRDAACVAVEVSSDLSAALDVWW
jgi:hypothetical protein